MRPEAREAQCRKAEAVLDRLRPGLIADGGNVELISIDDNGTVRLQLQGKCTTCPARSATVSLALEPALRHAVPGISSVVAF